MRTNQFVPKKEELLPDWQRNEFMGLNVANMRAAHQILDNPRIFEDPLALRVIGAEAESRLRSSLAQYQRPAKRAFRADVVVRNRYAEDELARSVHRGVRQYVILGAGLDTFAYRNPFPSLRVFEVDHPATQAWKRSCLEKAGIPIPESVTYASIDFETQSLVDALRESGFKSSELTFFSFIGVVRYLSWETIVSVFTSIVSKMRQGSEVIFDCEPPPSLLELVRHRALPGRTEVIFESSSILSLRRVLRRLAYGMFANRTHRNIGFRPTYFGLGSITRELKRMGFAGSEYIGSKEMIVRYCQERTDGLRVRNRMYLIKARV